jgi:hypothetical protein
MNSENESFNPFSKEDLKKVVLEGLRAYDEQKSNPESAMKTFSINELAIKLKRSHDTIKKLIKSGYLLTTADGKRILATSVNSYLKNQEL